MGYAEPLSEWADAIGYRSRHSDLPPDPRPFITRPSPSLLGGTEIDQVLHNSPTMTLTQYDTSAAGLWVGIADHRPVLTAYSGLTAKGMRPRFTHTYSQARSLHLRRFRPSVKQFCGTSTPKWRHTGYESKVNRNPVSSQKTNSATLRTMLLLPLPPVKHGSTGVLLMPHYKPNS